MRDRNSGAVRFCPAYVGFKQDAAKLDSEQASELEIPGGSPGQDGPPEPNDDCKQDFDCHRLSCIARRRQSGFNPVSDGWDSTSSGWREVYSELGCGGDAR